MSEIFSFLKLHHDTASAISAMAGVIIAFLALFVSLLSLCFTKRTLKLQKEHNRKSVHPLPYITVGDYEKSLYVKIRNTGTGPLIIKRLAVLGAENPSQSLVSNMPELPPGVNWTDFNGPTEGRSIAVNGEMVLLELSTHKLNRNFNDSRAKIREQLGKFSLELEYTDIYGSELPIYSRDLKWFHRTLEALVK